ncbi:MAG: cysteine desulfurase family protein [Phycisphaerae bacterium]|jgi:cysteine desulfurase
MSDIIYLDNNATTKPLAEVVAAMTPLLSTGYANPSSVHRFGQNVRHQVEQARAQVAALVNAEPKEIVFTSGGTEAINLAIRGTLLADPIRRHLITSTVEHSAVHRLANRLSKEGYEVDRIDVDGEGRLDFAALEAKTRDDTALISLMHANNETGVLFDVDRICRFASDRGIRLHVDAVQAAGKVPIDVKRSSVDLMSLSAHKMHGPKGVGALYVRKRTRLSPLFTGGRQERDLRPGTENAPAIVGFGVAAESAEPWVNGGVHSVRALRDEFENRVLDAIPVAHVIGRGAPRVCNTSNIGFERIQSEAILMLLSERGVCASAGAACSSGSLEPSHVLGSMGVDTRIGHGAIRFSLSRFTTPTEIRSSVDVLTEVIERLSATLPRIP